MVVFFFQFYNKLWQEKAKQLDLSVAETMILYSVWSQWDGTHGKKEWFIHIPWLVIPCLALSTRIISALWVLILLINGLQLPLILFSFLKKFYFHRNRRRVK